jgi:hypothetical protein
MRSTFSKNAFVDKRANLIVRVDNFLPWGKVEYVGTGSQLQIDTNATRSFPWTSSTRFTA